MRVLIPQLFVKKILFLKVSVSLRGFGPSIAHGKLSVRGRCVEATKNKAETCSLFDAIGSRSCGRSGLGIEKDCRGKSHSIGNASAGDWSRLYGTMRSESEAAFTRIQISGYLDIWMSGIRTSSQRLHACRIETFSTFTRVQTSGCIIRSILAKCRRNTQMLFLCQVTCLQTLFHFFRLFLLMFVGWKKRSTICLVSSISTIKHSVRWHGKLKIGRVNACEMAFKIDEAMWKLLNQVVLLQDKKRAKECFWRLRKEENTLSSRRKPQSACAVTSRYPDAPFSRVRSAQWHPDDPPLKSFRTAPDSVAYCFG